MNGGGRALNLSQVLVEECVEHFGETPPADIAAGGGDTPEYMAKVYEYLNSRDRWALCLSGGGIRSATFGLGLLQGLARRNLLSRFDYLSTVSGGGYIGSWLSAWAHRRAPDGERVGIAAVQRELSRACEGTAEPPEIRHLRNYSNYLTPKLGLMSADTWTGIGVYLRNLLLHWLMLVPLFVLPMFPAYWGWQLLQSKTSLTWAWIAFAAGAAALLWAMCFLSFHLPSARAWPLVGHLQDRKEIAAIQGRSQGEFLAYGLLPLVFAAACLSLALAWFWQQQDPLPETDPIGAIVSDLKGYFGGYWQIPLLVLAGAGGRFIAWYVALWRISMINRRIQKMKAGLGAAAASLRPSHNLTLPIILWELFVSLLCGGVGGLLVGVAVTQILGNPFAATAMFGIDVSALTHMAIYLCAAPPLFILTFLASESLFIGLTAYVTQDEDREWWGRAGGWMLIACLGWLVFHLLVMFGPVAIQWLNDEVAPSALAKYGGLPGLLSLASGAVAALLGASSKTPSAGNKAGEGRGGKMRGVALTVAAGLFLVSLFAGLAWVLSEVLFAASDGVADCGIQPCGPAEVPTRAAASILSTAAIVLARQQAVDWPPIVWVFIVLAGIGALAWRSINVNRFSMHSTYRDRLIRCYLGAARGNGGNGQTGHSRLRYPDRFTGFDPNDNLAMHELAETASSGGGGRVPLHILNIAVNLVNDKMLGWQQRKAASFTVSALHAGSDIFGYRPSKDYGGDDGMSLGTAMAISGAAASPNMGYHSSPVITLILALFNVRLGWWLGNPKRAERTAFKGPPLYRRDGPVWAAAPLIAECFGLTNKDSRFVYLSDGGHFENLGLYEMARRRCRHVVVSDAGCDPENLFADLGNAIRKIRVDLGVDIRMQAMFHHSRGGDYVPGAACEGFYCGIGTIAYPEGNPGTLVYIKPGLYGGEPHDVVNYACENAAFPHEPTSDQWFSESQFESYRRLGEHVAEQVIDTIGADEVDLKKLVESVTKAAKRG